MSHSILAAFESGKITAKQALDQIGKELNRKGISNKEASALMKVSEKILDAEVPLTDRNADAEEAYSARIRKTED